MSNAGRIVLVGEVVVDVTLLQPGAENKLRLGGVFHAARALWAIGAEYELAYFAPAYLERAVQDLASKHGASRATKIGDIVGSPNVMLIAEATEAGTQGYDHLLRDEYDASFDRDRMGSVLQGNHVSDILIFSGNFALKLLLAALEKTQVKIHIDIGNGPNKLKELADIGQLYETLFLSTSARAFPEFAAGLPGSAQAMAGTLAEKVVLKENRGGTRIFRSRYLPEQVGAQRRKIIHSVGVGDVYDAAFVAMYPRVGDTVAFHYAAWIAAEYAVTTFPDDFRKACERTLRIPAKELVILPSINFPWEARSVHSIYIAAPDFDYLDQSHIDALADCLRYHNFVPRLPVRENGQANEAMGREHRKRLCDADVELLRKCSLLIAVNSYDDPGTQIEIGLAHGWGIPVIVYDPHMRARNIMLTELPSLVTNSLDRVITATFDHLAQRSGSSP